MVKRSTKWWKPNEVLTFFKRKSRWTQLLGGHLCKIRKPNWLLLRISACLHKHISVLWSDFFIVIKWIPRIISYLQDDKCFTIIYGFHNRCVLSICLALVGSSNAGTQIRIHMYTSKWTTNTLCLCSEMTSTLRFIFHKCLVLPYTFGDQSRVFLRLSFKCLF